jgi:hypothetical protein
MAEIIQPWQHKKECSSSGPGYCHFCERLITETPQQVRARTQPPRVETGPVILNDDWPGIFIRGEQAIFFAVALEYMLENYHDNFGGEMSTEIKLMLKVNEGLLKTLQSCNIANCKNAKRLYVT